jgi:hypothetical protein
MLPMVALAQQGGVSVYSKQADLAIVNVLPDSFPLVSVVFKAETAGEPVWNLDKSQCILKENGAAVDIVSIRPLSENTPIHIGIVMDHSGSMLNDVNQLFDRYGNLRFGLNFFTGEIIYPKGYVAPMVVAKKAVRNFAKTFDFTKDRMGVVGFSSEVDKVLPLSQSQQSIDSIVNSMKADGNTALYDAMDAGLNLLSDEGALRVLITLTDGGDNQSAATADQIVARAKGYDIPLFIVGLGSINEDSLRHMARETGGQFYYARTAASLDSIYATISKKIQAFYDLRYLSDNLVPGDSVQNIVLSLTRGDSVFASASKDIVLPEPIVRYVVMRQQQRAYTWGGAGIVALGVISFLLVWGWRRRTQKALAKQSV